MPYQYRMDASSPCSSVPAAMVNPSAETSQESSPSALPAVDAVTSSGDSIQHVHCRAENRIAIATSIIFSIES